MEFGPALDAYLRKHNIKNCEMSRDTGISGALIAYWRSGERKPNLDNLRIISDYLNIPIDQLIRGNITKEDSRKQAEIMLKEDERELLDNYRLLNNRQKHEVQTYLYCQLDNEAGILER